MDDNSRIAVYTEGAVQILVDVLCERGSIDLSLIYEQAAGALSNIAISCDLEQALVDFGAVPALVSLLSHPTQEVIYAAVGALINLVTCKDMRIDFVREGGVHTLRDLLHDNQPEIIMQASTFTL